MDYIFIIVPLVALAKIYMVPLDEIIVIKNNNDTNLFVNEELPPYGLAKDTLDFIIQNSNLDTKSALREYYRIPLCML